MPRLPLVALLVAFGLVAGCGSLIGFGPEKTLEDEPQGGGGTGGMATGGMGGDDEPPPWFCEPDSDVVWLRTFGDASLDRVRSLSLAEDGGFYLSGPFRGGLDFGTGELISRGDVDSYVARFDADGRAAWAISYGTPFDEGIGPKLAAHPDGVALFVGTNHPLDLGGGEVAVQGLSAAFVTLLEDDGSHRWTAWLDGPGETFPLSITTDPATGDVIAYGAYNQDLILPEETLPGGGDNDAFVVRLAASDGAILHALRIGGTGGNWARRPLIAPDGRIVLIGSTAGAVDFGQGNEPSLGAADSYVAVLTADLQILWGRQYAYEGYQHFLDGALTPNGDIVAVGLLATGMIDTGGGLVGGGDSGYVTRLSLADGDVVDGMVLEGFTVMQGVAVDGAGNMVIAGEYSGSMTLANEAFSSVAGEGDAVSLSLTPGYELRWRDVLVGSPETDGFVSVVVDAEERAIAAGRFHGELQLDGCTLQQSAGSDDVMIYKRKN